MIKKINIIIFRVQLNNCTVAFIGEKRSNSKLISRPTKMFKRFDKKKIAFSETDNWNLFINLTHGQGVNHTFALRWAGEKIGMEPRTRCIHT